VNRKDASSGILILCPKFLLPLKYVATQMFGKYPLKSNYELQYQVFISDARPCQKAHRVLNASVTFSSEILPG
jgi:hypothetical protein